MDKREESNGKIRLFVILELDQCDYVCNHDG